MTNPIYQWVLKKQPTIKYVYKWIPKKKQVPVHTTRKDKWESSQQKVPHNGVVYNWVPKVKSKANAETTTMEHQPRQSGKIRYMWRPKQCLIIHSSQRPQVTIRKCAALS